MDPVLELQWWRQRFTSAVERDDNEFTELFSAYISPMKGSDASSVSLSAELVLRARVFCSHREVRACHIASRRGSHVDVMLLSLLMSRLPQAAALTYGLMID